MFAWLIMFGNGLYYQRIAFAAVSEMW